VRRLLIAFAVLFLGVSPALGKPKVAVTPMDGDSDGKMAGAVREMLDGKLAVVARKDVERAMSKLGLAGELESGDVQKLRQRLDAAVVVQGKLGRSGKKKTVKLSVWVNGKKTSDFNVQYKSVASEKFRDAVRDALLKRIGPLDDLDDGGEPPRKRVADRDDDERPKTKRTKKSKKADRDGGGDDGDDGDDGERPKKKKKKVADRGDDDDEGRPKARKRKRARDGEDEGDGEGVRERAARPLPAARVDAGFSYAARYLTYQVGANSPMRPPKVITPAGHGRFEAEIYPLALSNRESPLAGLGLFGEYDKTFGLSIDVPNTMGKSAPINQAYYAIGARYRLELGKSAISGGLAYTRRHYIADRSSLDQPTQLDAPDVDYAAIAPVLGARTQLAPRFALFGEASVMLVLAAGAITTGTYYGAGDALGFGGNLGVDVALGKQVGLRFAGELNQINLSFKGKGMSAARKVSGASDRDIGASLTLAAMY
jgi:hypothetical protein